MAWPALAAIFSNPAVIGAVASAAGPLIQNFVGGGDKAEEGDGGGAPAAVAAGPAPAPATDAAGSAGGVDWLSAIGKGLA